ncbi:MAG TPA: diguanylate cyclase [Candidatus Limiplasma sp.]|nr:diguanylate cyclase [Candidatus Limiplasma sp.]
MKAATMRAYAAAQYRRLRSEHRSVADECMLINNRRLSYGAAIAAAICLIPIIQLLPGGTVTDAPSLWRAGVLIVNIVMCAGLLLIWFFAFRTRKATAPTRGMLAMQLVSAAFFLLCGACVTLLDQLQTGNTSTFLLACISVGAVVLIRPLPAAALYAGAFTAMLVAGRFVLPNDLLFSVRTNGISSICMGMVVSVILWRANCTMLLQRRQLEKQTHILEQMAYYDKLTGLSNRHFFDAIIRQEGAPAQPRDEGALLMLDLDDFKRINDTYGHPAGDAMLCQLAQVLQDALRKTDVISRFGGEEFMVMLPKTPMQQATAVAEKLRETIEQTTFQLPGGVHEHMTASIGIAPVGSDGQAGDPYTLVDQALYKAKRDGKNSVACCWESAQATDTPAK